MWAARVSFIHCSAFGRVLAGDFSRVYSAAECLLRVSQLGLCVWQSVGALLSGAHRLLYGIRTSRLVYAPWIEYTNESHSSVQHSYGIGSGRVPKRCAHREGPKLRIILSHASRSMTSYSTWSGNIWEKGSGRLRLPFEDECWLDALRARQATWRHSGCSTWRHSGCSWQWALLQPRMAR